MARGFGSTYGSGTTDKVNTSLSAHATLRSYHMHVYRNGAGGGNVGRMFQKQTSAGGDIVEWLVFVNSATAYEYGRKWSGSYAYWRCTAPASGAWKSIGISYDASSTLNDPLMYIDGVSQSVSEVAGPSGTVSTNSEIYMLGNKYDDANNWDGMLARFAVWDAILTVDEFAALAKGICPLQIRPQSMVEYVEMLRDNVSRKLAAPTITGTAVQPHPLVMFVPRRHHIKGPSAAASYNLSAPSFSMTPQALTHASVYSAQVSSPQFQFTGNVLEQRTNAIWAVTSAAFNFTAQTLTQATAYAAQLTSSAFNFTAQTLTQASVYAAQLTTPAFNFVANSITYIQLVSYVASLTAAVFNMTPNDLTALYGRVIVLSSAAFNFTAQTFTRIGGKLDLIKVWRRRARTRL